MSNWLTVRFDRQQVERPQRADLVHAAGEAAAAQDQRGPARTAACAGPRSVRSRRRCPSTSQSVRSATSATSAGFRRLDMPMARSRRFSPSCSPSSLAPAAHAAGLAATQKSLASRDGARRGVLRRVRRRPRQRARRSTPARPTSPRMPGLGGEALHDRHRAAAATAPRGTLTTAVLADGAAGRGGRHRRQPLPARRRRPDVRRHELAAALAKQLADGGLTRDHGPRDRRRVGASTPSAAPPSSGYRTSSDVGPLSALTFNHGRTGKRRARTSRRSPAALRRRGVRSARSSARGVKIAGTARAGVAPAGADAAGASGPRRTVGAISRHDEPSRRTTTWPRR